MKDKSIIEEMVKYQHLYNMMLLKLNNLIYVGQKKLPEHKEQKDR